MMTVAEFKSARAEAEHVAALLRAALQRAGVSEVEAGQVRAMVSGAGHAYVHLGALRVSAATKLLDTLPLRKSSDGPTLPAESFG